VPTVTKHRSPQAEWGGSPNPDRTQGQQTGEAPKYNFPRRVSG